MQEKIAIILLITNFYTKFQYRLIYSYFYSFLPTLCGIFGITPLNIMNCKFPKQTIKKAGTNYSSCNRRP